MNAIGSFLTTGEKAMANAYISEITHVMRHMVENIGREYIPFSLNLEILTRYLNAERIRMDMKFDYEILTADLNTEDLFIVPGMIQPFLGNSIRHGLPAGDEKKIKIILQFEPSTDKFITCIIQDNGKGWDESSKGNHNKLRASHGLQIIRERIRLYNELNKTKLTLSITNLYPDQEAKGTLVKINIPIKRERMK
jgi:LytS/YehU family sensor histidine kinase